MAKQRLFHTIFHGLFIQLTNVLDRLMIAEHCIRVCTLLLRWSSSTIFIRCCFITRCEYTHLASPLICGDPHARFCTICSLLLSISLFHLRLPSLSDFSRQLFLPIEKGFSPRKWKDLLMATFQLSVYLRKHLALLAFSSHVCPIGLIEMSSLLVKQVSLFWLG